MLQLFAAWVDVSFHDLSNAILQFLWDPIQPGIPWLNSTQEHGNRWKSLHNGNLRINSSVEWIMIHQLS